MAEAKSKKLCFVIGPIGPDDSDVRIHADWFLEEIVTPTMADFPEFRVKRADQDMRPGLIDAQMINDLLTADLVIADLSFHNPNAFYEIGIRHMAQKPIIHMLVDSEPIPFDLSLFRSIKFNRKRPIDIRSARKALHDQVAVVLGEGYEVENPVTNARGRVKLEEKASPETRVLLEQVRAIENRLDRLEPQMHRDHADTYDRPPLDDLRIEPSRTADFKIIVERHLSEKQRNALNEYMQKHFPEHVTTGDGYFVTLPATFAASAKLTVPGVGPISVRKVAKREPS
jgi:hypothetical protein